MGKYGISDIIDQRMREIKTLSQKMKDLINKAGDKTSTAEREKLISFEAAITDCKKRALELENENFDLVKMNTELIKKLEKEREKSATETKELTKEIFKLSDANSNMKTLLDNSAKELEALKKQQQLFIDDKIRSELHESMVDNSEFQELQNKYFKIIDENKNLLSINSTLNQKILDYEAEITENLTQTNNLKDILTQKDLQVCCYKNEVIFLKEQIRQLQGKITVICRIKPSTQRNSLKTHQITATEEKITVDKNTFSFDNVLLPHSDQKAVYEQFSSMIDSLIHGYNVCILAYGQTGSGKTFTMEGDSINPGLIPTALSKIYGEKERLGVENIQLSLSASVFEIYNESIIDLLDTTTKKCEIKHSEHETTISNSIQKELNTFQEALDLLKIASTNRSVGETQCNIRSSRSHLIFRLTIRYTDTSKKEIRTGTLNLIDLAGSERLNESKAEGLRLKETTNINLSLTALGNVINSVAQNSQHIPYRSSKLTYYLQNYFSGKSFIALIVNISSEFRHANETLCSLRFAEKVRRCTVGKQTKNIKVGIS